MITDPIEYEFNKKIAKSPFTVNVLYTDGDKSFKEITWAKPAPKPNEIVVKALLTGVCRSDVEMMLGTFAKLPVHMSGHEGLGVVICVGSEVTDVQHGWFVATRGEPAYADYYNAPQGTYVRVPSCEPKYIVEPVACGINIIDSNIEKLREKQGGKLIILGSGFLAYIAYETLKYYELDYEVTVVGNSNKKMFDCEVNNTFEGTYDVIIDLSEKPHIFHRDVMYNENALIIMCTQKDIETNFANMLWKSVTMTFPSPRNPNFHSCMQQAVDRIKNGTLKVDHFWTKGYDRTTEWQAAFSDSKDRRFGYNRAYLKWGWK
jgi:threonine dehydrogenase-like Zn-dependent dehydrogenase